MILRGIFENLPHFVAVNGGKVVGWCNVAIQNGTAFAHCGTLGMGVIAPYRRQGIGYKLLRRTVEAAKKNGLERLELQVYNSNLPAITLYKRFGFHVEGVKQRGAKIDGRYEDCVLMVLNLL